MSGEASQDPIDTTPGPEPTKGNGRVYAFVRQKLFLVAAAVVEQPRSSRNRLTFKTFLPRRSYICYVIAQELPSLTYAVAMSLCQIIVAALFPCVLVLYSVYILAYVCVCVHMACLRRPAEVHHGGIPR